MCLESRQTPACICLVYVPSYISAQIYASVHRYRFSQNRTTSSLFYSLERVENCSITVQLVLLCLNSSRHGYESLSIVV